MNYREFVATIVPRVLRGRFGRAFAGTTAFMFDALAASLKQAVRSAWVGDTPGNGPAHDGLSASGSELSLPRYPRETWSQYHERLQRAWTDWPLAGDETSIVSQLAAAGWPGAEVQFEADWPSLLTTWSQFVVFFPEGTHLVLPAAEIGSFLIGDGTLIGPRNITLEDIATLRAIIRKFKPAHWVCRYVVFDCGGGDYAYVGVQ